MKLAHVPLHQLAPGDRVRSYHGVPGRIGAIYRAGDLPPTPLQTNGKIDEPRILILWDNCRWTISEHHLLDEVTVEINRDRDLPLYDKPGSGK